jgi:hypothetical protein
MICQPSKGASKGGVGGEVYWARALSIAEEGDVMRGVFERR